MMEWEKQQQLPQVADSNRRGGGAGDGTVGGRVTGGNAVPYVKVMTDEQLETLRKQIAIYASICEQLVEMHKNLTAQQDLAGVRLGTLYCDPLVTPMGHKITARQRWTPTPVQLQVLEQIFNQGNGTPTKQKIKEITSELSQHGQISETNVYNWFQNRRARSKRKQQNSTSHNGESEVEVEAEGESQSPKEEKTNPEAFLTQHHNPVPRLEDLPFQSPQISSDLHFVDSPPTKVESLFPSDGSLRPESRSFGHMSYYDDLLSHTGNGHLTGKMEVPGGYNLYHQHADDYTV